MSIRTLCCDTHPILRRPARRIEVFTAALRQSALDLSDTMRAYHGIGLAAPQIGQGLQLIVVNVARQPGRDLVMVNPLIESTRGSAAMTEGCLSLPRVWERIQRAAHIRVVGQTVDGDSMTIEADGLLATALQHEIDHLHGWLIDHEARAHMTARPHQRSRSAPSLAPASLVCSS